MRPPQPATMVPRCWLPEAPQTSALSTRPPSSGRPGTRLSTPISRLAPARQDHRLTDEPVGHDVGHGAGRGADRDRGERTDDGDPELVARAPRLPVDLRHAAEEVQRDRVDAVAQALGDDRVGRLVEQDGEVEHDREHEAGDVLPEPQTGLGCLDARPERQRDQQRDDEPRGGDEDVDARRSTRCAACRAGAGGAAGRRRQTLDRWVRTRLDPNEPRPQRRPARTSRPPPCFAVGGRA